MEDARPARAATTTAIVPHLIDINSISRASWVDPGTLVHLLILDHGYHYRISAAVPTGHLACVARHALTHLADATAHAGLGWRCHAATCPTAMTWLPSVAATPVLEAG